MGGLVARTAVEMNGAVVSVVATVMTMVTPENSDLSFLF